MPETTVPPATDAPTTTTPTSIPATGPCPGDGPVPAGATDSVTIDGDIDGDAVADEVTSYSLAGVPHVHARLAIGQQSDVELPLGFADTVQISFEDFDHSLGAPTPPPVAVLAIGAGNAGSAFLAFLTLTRDYCIQPWTTGGSPFSIRVSQQGPYTGLFCDRGAGQVHYSVVTAEQQTGGDWLVTTSEIKHNFTAATLNPLPDQTVPDSPGIPSQYGDIVNCDHAPLFP